MFVGCVLPSALCPLPTALQTELVSEKAERIAQLRAKQQKEFAKTKPKVRCRPKRMDKSVLVFKPPVMEPVQANINELLNMNRNVLRKVTDASKLLAEYSLSGWLHTPSPLECALLGIVCHVQQYLLACTFTMFIIACQRRVAWRVLPFTAF